MEFVDTHAHLDDPAFGPDLDAVIERAAAAGVGTIVTIGTTVESSRDAVALAERFPQVLAAVGVHPHEAGQTAPQAIHGLRPLCAHPRVAAVGETGLDFYREWAPRAAQEDLFRAHLRLAREVGLPVVIHCRDAYPDVLAALAEYPDLRVVMHAFSGTIEIARECLERGYYLALGGPVTFTNARHPVEVAKVVDADRLLIETDSPYLTPHPFRGKRNEPSHLVLTARRVAEVRGETVEGLAGQTTSNARGLFGSRVPVSA